MSLGPSDICTFVQAGFDIVFFQCKGIGERQAGVTVQKALEDAFVDVADYHLTVLWRTDFRVEELCSIGSNC